MANIVLLDNEGVARTYQDIQTATFNTAEGGLVTFTAPEEHNDAWIILQDILNTYSEEYTVYKYDTLYGTYLISNMFDFGIWLVNGPNAYHIMPSGAFENAYICGKFILFEGSAKYPSYINGELLNSSIYWHDGNVEHSAQYLTGKERVGSWGANIKTDISVLAWSASRCIIILYDALLLPIVLTDFLGDYTYATSQWTPHLLSDNCYLILPDNYLHGGPVLFYTDGRVVYLEPFAQNNNPSLVYRISDTVYAIGGYYTDNPLVIINVAAGTAETLLTNGIGVPLHYHVASSTIFCQLDTTWHYYDLANHIEGTVGSPDNTNQSTLTLLTNGLGILCFRPMEYPLLTSNNSISIGQYCGYYNYGFSLFNFETRTIQTIATSGRYDTSCLYYAGGTIALMINSWPFYSNNRSSHAEYTEYAYAINVNTATYEILTVNGTQVRVNARLYATPCLRTSPSNNVYYTGYYITRQGVFFTDSNTAFITFWNSSGNYRKQLYKYSADASGALELVHTFVSECIGCTMGGQLPQEVIDFIHSEDALNDYSHATDCANLTGYTISGQARIYSSSIVGKRTSGSSAADFTDDTCVLVRANKEPYVFKKECWYQTSRMHLTNILASNMPIRDHIYVGGSSSGDLLLIDLDNNNPIIDTFNVLGESRPAPIAFINAYVSIATLSYSNYFYVPNIRIGDVSLDRSTTCKAISMLGSTILLSDDLSTFLGGNTASTNYDSNYFYPFIRYNADLSNNNKYQDAFDFVNANVLLYTGDISTDSYYILLQAKAAPHLCIELYRVPDTTLDNFTQLSYNIMRGIFTTTTSAYFLVYSFLATTPYGCFYSLTKDAREYTSDTLLAAIYKFATRRGLEQNIAAQYFSVYNKGYSWLEAHSGADEGDIEIIRPGYPIELTLLWDESAQQMIEVTTSEVE